MLCDEVASPALLAIEATADMDDSVIGLEFHSSPPSFERKEASSLYHKTTNLFSASD
jgi:hypothetical protein